MVGFSAAVSGVLVLDIFLFYTVLQLIDSESILNHLPFYFSHLSE